MVGTMNSNWIPAPYPAPVPPTAPYATGQPPPQTPPTPPRSGSKGRLGAALAAIAAFLAKFKVILLVLPKLKLFTSAGTMLVSLAAYSFVFGWQFAAGFV